MYLLSIVQKVTIEGPDGGGVTWHIDVQHEPLELTFDAELMALLAGRAAEEVILGNSAAHRDGGADSDLALASDIAFRIETTLGFGKKWPLLHWPPSDRAALYAKDPDLAERVHERLRRAFAAARTLVRKQEEAIRWLADVLLHHPTLEGPLLAQVFEEVDKRPDR
jgi:ATP-dependent Zn protease